MSGALWLYMNLLYFGWIHWRKLWLSVFFTTAG